jgi:ATP-dependent Clp protease ATP-binding subunit ClpA
MPPSTPEETLEVLAGRNGHYEKHHNVRFSEDTLRQADRFIHTTSSPIRLTRLAPSLRAVDEKAALQGKTPIENGIRALAYDAAAKRTT